MNTLFSFVIPLFILMDFIGTIPVFLSLTNHVSSKERFRIAILASLTAGGIVLAFALIGQVILQYFSLSIEAIRVGGGLLLLYIAFEMILSGQSMYAQTGERDHIIVSPLAIPMLAGPGSMTFAMISWLELPGMEKAYLIGAIAIVSILGAIILSLSTLIHKLLGTALTRGLEKITAVIVSFIALEMIMSGIKQYFFG